MAEVVLAHYRPEYLEALKAFYLPDEQKQFTAMPEDIVDANEGQYPIVILAEGVPVGCFLIQHTDRVKEYSDNPNAMLLTALSMDLTYQGKGYAKAGMSELMHFIPSEFPKCDEIILAVNHKNVAAQKLYEKVGFRDTGRRKFGRKGEQYLMDLSLKRSLSYGK
ncbi:GNAT family N-acetyltransferase [Filobacillus milosensis]|uniref:GNAT family N-acetyltransferase n=1 Tax=Filobacillus milosensis TaxID=94137 RepID=A0A4Y8IP18_9BACI|nr:GNAT family N-acetyltransferase [Filobacillus milosensis]TFB21377.1 GNAT family N-acetyltransferase [Filobacillus milosensis]